MLQRFILDGYARFGHSDDTGVSSLHYLDFTINKDVGRNPSALPVGGLNPNKRDKRLLPQICFVKKTRTYWALV